MWLAAFIPLQRRGPDDKWIKYLIRYIGEGPTTSGLNLHWVTEERVSYRGEGRATSGLNFISVQRGGAVTEERAKRQVDYVFNSL